MFHECIHYGTNLRLEFVSADKVNGIGDVLLLGNLVEGNQSILIAAVFTDEYERRDGVWKFSKRNACTNYFTPLAGIHFAPPGALLQKRSEEHTSELQSLMRISYAVFCLHKNTKHTHNTK